MQVLQYGHISTGVPIVQVLVIVRSFASKRSIVIRTEASVNKVAVLLVGVKIQVSQAEVGKHFADIGYVPRRAQTFATTTLIVAVA